MLATEQGGIGNRLTLLDDEIEGNLRAVQLRNGLPPTTKAVARLHGGDGNGYGQDLRLPAHDVRAEPRYGFTKFVIVVPSVAIKEGVNKTLQITREHFEAPVPGRQGLRVLPVRLGQAGPGAQLRDQPEHPDHGHHRGRHQQVR